MCGGYEYNDETRLTYTGNEINSSSTYIINTSSYLHKQQVHKQTKKLNKKELQAIRAKALHKSSMVILNQIQSNLYSVIDHKYNKQMKNSFKHNFR